MLDPNKVVDDVNHITLQQWGNPFYPGLYTHNQCLTFAHLQRKDHLFLAGLISWTEEHHIMSHEHSEVGRKRGGQPSVGRRWLKSLVLSTGVFSSGPVLQPPLHHSV